VVRNRLIVNLISRHLLTSRAWWRITLIFSMILAYGALFFPLHFFWGDAVLLLNLIPIALSGWSFGPVFGVVVSLLVWLFNAALWSLSRLTSWTDQLGLLAVVTFVAFILTGYLSGRFSIVLNRRFITAYAPGEMAVMMEQNRIPGNFEAAVVSLVGFLREPAFAINLERRVVCWNQEMEALTGLRAGEILGRSCREAALPFYEAGQSHLAELIIHDPDKILVEYPGVSREGLRLVVDRFVPRFKPDGVFLRIQASPLFDLDGNLVGALQSMRNISEEQYEPRRGDVSGEQDPITGMYNAEAFTNEIKRLESVSVCPTSILLVKFITSPSKTERIDEGVKRYTPIIQTVFRTGDMIAYLGDGEVAVLLPRSDSKMAQQIAERLRKSLAQGKNSREDVVVVNTNVIAVTCQEAGALLETFTQGRQYLKSG
jgi:PAS domain-containing protein